MRLLWPRSLFGRTSLLLAATVLACGVLAWQATMWSVVVPSATLSADMLSQRLQLAIAAYRDGRPAPDGTRLENQGPRDVSKRFPGFAFGTYLAHVNQALRAQFPDATVVVVRARAPSEIWVRTPSVPDRWIVLSWRIGSSRAPAAALGVLAAAALLVLGASAWSARRLSKPLANLAGAAAHVAEGELVAVDTSVGPAEVRSLAMAFESMAQRLSELESQRELLLAGVSHDLRSPLARIRVAVELLDAREAGLAGQIALEIEEMDRMIGQFLHYARAGYRELPQAAVLDRTVAQALIVYGNDPRVRSELHAPQPCLLAVAAVRQIVVNLVENALEYGAPPVVVRTEAGAGHVQVRVGDAGKGLSADEWRRALQPFARLHGAYSAGHSGLGLALVQRLVTACRGTLTAANSPGGFTVTVRLEAAAPPAGE